jgi:hypothetical protein
MSVFRDAENSEFRGVGVRQASPQRAALGNARGRSRARTRIFRSGNSSLPEKYSARPQVETVFTGRTAFAVRREVVRGRVWGDGGVGACKPSAGASDRQERGPDFVGRSRRGVAEQVPYFPALAGNASERMREHRRGRMAASILHAQLSNLR